LRQQGYRIVATSPHGDSPSIYELDISKPFALIFGTERLGISEDVKKLADEFVRIPMYGFSESFNISVSVAIMLNVFRQRLEKSNIEWKLNESEQTELKMTWCKSILNGGPLIEAEIRRRLFEKE
jgi:tRNA (guanosine-2'-O-)-methyltransferase